MINIFWDKYHALVKGISLLATQEASLDSLLALHQEIVAMEEDILLHLESLERASQTACATPTDNSQGHPPLLVTFNQLRVLLTHLLIRVDGAGTEFRRNLAHQLAEGGLHKQAIEILQLSMRSAQCPDTSRNLYISLTQAPDALGASKDI